MRVQLSIVACRQLASAVRPGSPVRRVVRLAPVVLLAALGTACAADRDGEPLGEPTISEVDGVRVVQNHAPQWAEGEGWKISTEPSLTLGVDSGDQAQMFTYPRPKRLVDGTIVVADWGTKEVRAFNGEGEHLWSAGGEGQGPGEFESIAYLIVLPTGGLAVTDSRKPRVTLFSSSGDLLGSFDQVPQPDDTRFYATPMIEAAFADGSFLATTGARDGSVGAAPGERTWRTAGAWRYSAEADDVEFLAELDFYETIGESHGAPVPFDARGWIRPHAGGFYYVNGRSPVIEDHDAEGTLRARFVLPRDPVPLTAEDRERWLKKSLDNWKEAGQELSVERQNGMIYPDTMPTWRNVLVDADNNLWIERVLGLQHVLTMHWGAMNSDPFFPVTDSVWDVISPQGYWLGAVDLPPGHNIVQIGDTWVLTSGDDASGVARVYLYDLIKD